MIARALPLLFGAFLAAGCAGGGGGGGDRRSSGGPSGGGESEGQRLYAAGRLEDAEPHLRAAVRADPADALSLRLLGRIEMLRNRLDEARRLFEAALRASEGTDFGAAEDLTLVLYRQDDYAGAAKWFKSLNDTVLARKYADMARRGPPYTPAWRGDVSTVRFFTTAPQPLVQMRVNGLGGVFAIDTGTGELVLDRAFAKEAGARVVTTQASAAAESGEEAYVDTLDLPSLTIRNVPAAIRSLRSGEREIDGVIGAGLLSHFTFTLDYRREQLVLRKRGRGVEGRGAEVPLYFAGDRYFLVPVAVDGGTVALSLVRTGAAGVAFAPSPGLAATLPRVTQARLGPLTPPVQGPSPAFPAGLDYSYGFLIGGLVGPDAFRNRSATFDLDRMRLILE